MKLLQVCIIAILISLINCYLDVELVIRQQNEDKISYSIPITIKDQVYMFTLSLQDEKQYINIKDNNKKSIVKHNINKMNGVLQAVNFKDWKQDNWRGLIKQLLLYIEGRFDNQLHINFSPLPELFTHQFGDSHDAVLTFGPGDNKIYTLLLNSTSLIQNKIISIYRANGHRSSRIQFGGIQLSYTKPDEEGVRFRQVLLQSRDNKWIFGVKSIAYLRYHSDDQQVFNLPNSNFSMAISLNETGLKLPKALQFQIQQILQSAHSSCKILQTSYLSCNNFTKSQLQTNSLILKLSQSDQIQFSLSQLAFPHNKSQQKATTNTIFNIEFIQSDIGLIGEVLYKKYYVSLDLQHNKLKYALYNHQAHIFGISLVKFVGGLVVFVAISAFGLSLGVILLLRRPKGYRKLEAFTK